MGKLMDRLKLQLKRPEFKEDAKEYIEIYNWIKSTDKEGRVWSSRWEPLVDVKFVGFKERNYSLSIAGKNLLKGLMSEKKELIDNNCDLKRTDFENIESLLFTFWSNLQNDVDCINSENIVSKIKQFCEEENLIK